MLLRSLLLVVAVTTNFCRADVRQGDGVPGETCRMGGGVVGRCEEVGACLKGGGILKREGQVHTCQRRSSQVFVCCRRPKEIAKQLCDVWAWYWRGEDGTCPTNTPLIIGGEEANVGEFPHMALLGRERGNQPIEYFCGGTLISPHYVLSAAHCLYESSQEIRFWVKLGEHDTEYDSSYEFIPILKGPIPPGIAFPQDFLLPEPPSAFNLSSQAFNLSSPAGVNNHTHQDPYLPSSASDSPSSTASFPSHVDKPHLRRRRTVRFPEFDPDSINFFARPTVWQPPSSSRHNQPFRTGQPHYPSSNLVALTGIRNSPSRKSLPQTGNQNSPDSSNSTMSRTGNPNSTDQNSTYQPRSPTAPDHHSTFMSHEESSEPFPDLATVEQTIEVEAVHWYPDHKFRYRYHDLVLLKLKEPARLTKRVIPACLPINPEEDYLGKRLTVVGWGHTIAGVKELSRTLQKVTVPVVDRLTCTRIVGNPRDNPLGITSDMLCAGEEGKDSCKGDSGGPLSEQVSRRGGTFCEHTVAGVVSFGEGTGSSSCGRLGVHIRVASYLDWITGYIAPGSLSGGSYDAWQQESNGTATNTRPTTILTTTSPASTYMPNTTTTTTTTTPKPTTTTTTTTTTSRPTTTTTTTTTPSPEILLLDLWHKKKHEIPNYRQYEELVNDVWATLQG